MRPDASKKLAAAAPKQGPNAAVIGAVIAAVILMGVVVFIWIASNSKNNTSAAGSGNSAPLAAVGGMGAGVQVNDSTATSSSSATAKSSTPTASTPTANAATPKSNAPAAKSNAPTLDVWEDFQCPGCGQLEERIGAQLALMAKAGEIKLVVHMLSFLDGKLGNDSSARSSNAAACASDAGKFLEYHAAVFAAQPAREGDGYTDAQLTQFATTSGITGAALTTWQTCTTSGQYAKYVTSVQEGMDKALKEEGDKAMVKATPTVVLNGTTNVTDSVQTPEALVALVKSATK